MRGGVTSPTFVIARVHPPLGDGPDLVHVDAYRLGGSTSSTTSTSTPSLDDAVTVVEWGAGLAEGLADDAPGGAAAARGRRRRDAATDEDPRERRDPAGRAALARRGAGPHRRARSLDAVLLAFDTATPLVSVALARRRARGRRALLASSR